MARTPIWLVEIIMPKKLMQEINQGSLELESGTVDAQDIEASYEQDVDKQVNQTDAAAPTAAVQGNPNVPQ